MRALIDGDVLVYRIGFTVSQDDPEWIAKARLSESIRQILHDTNSDSYEIWLSDSHENWRNKLWPLYKANRTQPKPYYYEYLTNLLLDEWKAEVAYAEEADDALGIQQTRYSLQEKDGSCICSIDKDLKQIPGNHYDFVKGELSYVTPHQGLFKFYHQILTGDSSDNITVANGLSCKGIGKVKADRILEHLQTEGEMFDAVVDTYRESWKGLTDQEILDKILLTGQLIKIRTKDNEIWTFPKNVNSVVVSMDLFMKTQEKVKSL